MIDYAKISELQSKALEVVETAINDDTPELTTEQYQAKMIHLNCAFNLLTIPTPFGGPEGMGREHDDITPDPEPAAA